MANSKQKKYLVLKVYHIKQYITYNARNAWTSFIEGLIAMSDTLYAFDTLRSSTKNTNKKICKMIHNLEIGSVYMQHKNQTL